MPQRSGSLCKTTATRNGLTNQNFGWSVGVLDPSERREPMMSLRIGVRFVVTTAILLAILADAAKGQARRDRHVVGGGRIATIAPAPTPVATALP